MRRFLTPAALAVFALAPVACNKSPEGGTPGTDQTFSLTTSPGATHLKHGEEKTIVITVRRDAKFTEPVTLKVDSQDKDIKAELSKTTADPGDKEITLKVKADEKAALGDHPIKVTATPKTGKPADLNVTVTVDKPA